MTGKSLSPFWEDLRLTERYRPHPRRTARCTKSKSKVPFWSFTSIKCKLVISSTAVTPKYWPNNIKTSKSPKLSSVFVYLFVHAWQTAFVKSRGTFKGEARHTHHARPSCQPPTRCCALRSQVKPGRHEISFTRASQNDSRHLLFIYRFTELQHRPCS